MSDDCARISRGPSRAPGRYDAPPSNGTPRIATSRPLSVGHVRQAHERRRLREARRFERFSRAGMVHRSEYYSRLRTQDSELTKIHRNISPSVAALPCMRMPVRKILPAAHTQARLVRVVRTTERHDLPGRRRRLQRMRRSIRNGVAGGKSDRPTDAGPFGLFRMTRSSRRPAASTGSSRASSATARPSARCTPRRRPCRASR